MIRKHSATLHGHRTSFSLEDEFWLELKAIAAARRMSLASLIAEIDDARTAGNNLSSALRLYVLAWLKSGGSGSQPKTSGKS
ncbi:aryl-sulfate sulfotransferase [Rhizobium deserti]|uniref:Aryl-sulfate sulfotransferase n=1 Tax=Rhizobium deserti TaxID=2547961 RepID=A0A4R5UIY8_9HYPH|nr:ribbon-helix-helix domain-containing protein [Rhizobium deserti]TDK36817.1 aryl-sulfate sulfotransferase [Rhizobium deserti]